MWNVEKTITFEASHVLPLHNGKCARLHGHSWKASVAFGGMELQESGPQSGMVIDFGEIKRVLSVISDLYLDHHHLNDSLGLANPTSEAIAKWLFDQVDAGMTGVLPKGVWLSWVKVEETCTSACMYFRDPVVITSRALGEDKP